MCSMPTLLLDSLSAFWSMTAGVQHGGTLAEAEWDALFQTSAYQMLAPEFEPAVLRRRFELAFAPGREAEALAAAQQDSLLAHYLWIKAEQERIRAFVAHLDLADLMARVLQCCSRWLPPESAQNGRMPAVTLAIFDADARGYDAVVMDAGLALRLGEANLILLLAHECHHGFRNRIGAAQSALPDELAWVLDQIQAEGIADQINVPTFQREGGLPDGLWPGWAEAYRAQVEQAPAFLHTMDQLLGQMAASPATAGENAGRLQRLLPMAGHPIGYYMANRIMAAGLCEAMVATCADSVHFLRLYAEACQRLGTACELSPDSLRYLSDAARQA